MQKVTSPSHQPHWMGLRITVLILPIRKLEDWKEDPGSHCFLGDQVFQCLWIYGENDPTAVSGSLSRSPGSPSPQKITERVPCHGARLHTNCIQGFEGSDVPWFPPMTPTPTNSTDHYEKTNYNLCLMISFLVQGYFAFFSPRAFLISHYFC